ncbi:MAG TPA: hypothetical protein VGM02_11450 [Acidobacteriaceae bacterium]|jgi:hypothetical protein
MAIYTFEGVTPEVLDKGFGELRSSGFAVDGNRVSGMGVEASFELTDDVLTVNVEKSPAYLGGMVEAQLRSFFS